MAQIMVDVLKPFGPRIFKLSLPKDVIGKLVYITDNLISNEDRKSYGCNLAGQIKEEVEISKGILKKEGLYNTFNNYLKSYIEHCLLDLGKFNNKEHKVYCDLTDMWFNEMKQGEYNPIHYHTSCHVSSVLYLKIPPNKIKRNIECKSDKDGQIEFVDRSVGPNLLQRSSLSINPKVGDMYMWPSSLLHTVYPFLGDGIRRSIAWNGTYRLCDVKDNRILLGGSPTPSS